MGATLALESVRAANPAFTPNGIPTDEEIKKYLLAAAQILKLAKSRAATEFFDFSLQTKFVRTLGLK